MDRDDMDHLPVTPALDHETVFDTFTSTVIDTNAKTYIIESCVRCRRENNTNTCEIAGLELRPLRPSEDGAALSDSRQRKRPRLDGLDHTAGAVLSETGGNASLGTMLTPLSAASEPSATHAAQGTTISTSTAPALSLPSDAPQKHSWPVMPTTDYLLRRPDGNSLFDGLGPADVTLLHMVADRIREAEARGLQQRLEESQAACNSLKRSLEYAIQQVDRLQGEKVKLQEERTADLQQMEAKVKRAETELSSSKKSLDEWRLKFMEVDRERDQLMQDHLRRVVNNRG